MLTEIELDRRRRFMTASNAYTVLGLNPWAKPIDVYYEKVHGTSVPAGEAAHYGNLLEPIVLQLAAENLKTQVQPGDWSVSDDGINAATLDGRLDSTDIVEAKTSGIVGPGNPREWGEEGTDEIPDRYLVQVQHQMYCAGARRAWVPALIGGRGFVMYCVQRSASLGETVAGQCREFWHDHVERRIAPHGIPSIEVVKNMIRVPGKSADVPRKVAQEFITARELRLAAEKSEETAQAALLAALVDAEFGKWPGGSLTYKEQHRKAYSVSETTFRVLRVKQDKALSTHTEELANVTR